MKKVTKFLDGELGNLLINTSKFKNTLLLHYANALVSFATEFVILGQFPPLHFPIVCASTIMPDVETLEVLKEVRERTGRIEARLRPFIPVPGILVWITFFSKGPNCPLLTLSGGVGSTGISHLEVTSTSDMLDSAKFFTADQRSFALIGT